MLTFHAVMPCANRRFEMHQKDLVGLSDRVWATPETLYGECAPCAEHTAMLRDKGFAVTEAVAGAVMGEGGPVIAILGEYDALPGLSQEAVGDFPKPVEEGGADPSRATTCLGLRPCSRPVGTLPE
ncbi:hypothetical protein K3762_18230 (plasmid) [Sulfitobacter sp. W074]|nr:hypothetical protein K3762_18230 [Sulfitobacter sp. W074]